MPRPKGSPNKLTAEIKQKLSEVIMDAMSSIDIDSMTQNEKLKLIQIGLTYVIPKLKQVENIEEEEPRNFQIEIIDSLSKYSNYEIDKAIKNKL
jgi:ATP-dependent Lon protease